jgi:hypothetical protein
MKRRHTSSPFTTHLVEALLNVDRTLKSNLRLVTFPHLVLLMNQYTKLDRMVLLFN